MQRLVIGARPLFRSTQLATPMVSFSTAEAGPVQQRIRTAMQQTFTPSHLEVEDESHKHASHAAMRNVDHGETHFKVIVVSEQFASLSPIERHRLVNDSLATEMDAEQGGTVHALSIKAKTPEQWAKQTNKQ